MAHPNTRALQIAIGMILIIISPAIIALYALLTGSMGILGVILATFGTYMIINFYNAKDTWRTVGLLFGPALILIGLYLIINF